MYKEGNKRIGAALDINDLMDARSNQQFIDKLSNELSRGNHRLNGTAEKLRGRRRILTEGKDATFRSAKALGVERKRFNLNNFNGQSRSNADLLSIDKHSYKLWQAQNDTANGDDEDFGSNHSLDHQTAMSLEPNHAIKQASKKNILKNSNHAHEVSAPPPIET